MKANNKIHFKKWLIIFGLSAIFIPTYSQGLQITGSGNGRVEEKIFYKSLRKLIPNQNWMSLSQFRDLSSIGNLELVDVSLPDMELDKVILIRKGDKLHQTTIFSSGKRNCGLLLDYDFESFGELTTPLKNSKNELIFEWEIDENFAQQKVTYHLNKTDKTCTTKMVVIF